MPRSSGLAHAASKIAELARFTTPRISSRAGEYEGPPASSVGSLPMPGVGGTVTVKFTWSSEDGTLKDTVVDPAGSSAPAEVQQCVTKALTGLTLDPKDAKDGMGTWKFEFHAPPPAAPAAPQG